MKTIVRLTLIIATALVLTTGLVSCSTTDPLKKAEEIYPDNEYVKALGYGRTQEEADTNALSNLSTIFGAQIETNTVLGTKERNKDGETKHEDFFSSATSISSRIDNLFGITIPERGKDKNGFYSLAILEKKSTIHNSKEKLKDTEKEITNLEKEAYEAIGTLPAISYGVSLVSKVENYNTLAMTINYLNSENNPLMSLAKAKAILSEATNSVLIYIDVTGDVNGIVEGRVSDSLTSKGFSITKDKERAQANLIITIHWVESKGTGVAEDFVFQEYSAKASLEDTNSNKTIFSCSESGKEGHVTFEGAKMRAIENASEAISSKLEEEMRGSYYL